MQDEMPLGTSLSLKVGADEDYHVFQTLFVDHPKGMGVSVSLCSINTNEDREEKGHMD